MPQVRRSPRNVRITYNHRGLSHFGGSYFFHEFLRVLHFRNYVAGQIHYPRRNRDYSVSQMLLALVHPILLVLDRIETAALLHTDETFQYLTGLQSFPDPQTLRRFLLNAPADLREQLHRANDRLLQRFIHLPKHRSRLIFDLDRRVPRLATIRVIAASAPKTRCSVWKRTPRSCGMSNCDAAMREPGRAVKNFWPPVFCPPLPTSEKFGCGPMRALATGRFWICWKRVSPNTQWSRAWSLP